MIPPAEIEGHPKIGYVVKNQSGGRHAELHAAIGAAYPLDNVIDIED